MRQVALKPQDLIIAVKLAISPPDRQFTYATLAIELQLAASEVHSAYRRANQCKLVSSTDRFMPAKAALREFIVHGLQYVFPPILGAPSRGLATGVDAPVLRSLFANREHHNWVWPHAEGSVFGISFAPLYPSLPKACMADQILYDAVALLDAIRGGAAREREAARKILEGMLV